MTDLRPYGSAPGLTFYLVQYEAGWIGRQSLGRALQLIAIDDLGNVKPTRQFMDWRDDAPTEEEVVREHMAAASRQAEANLERFRRDHPRPSEPEKSPPMDPATRRFLGG